MGDAAEGEGLQMEMRVSLLTNTTQQIVFYCVRIVCVNVQVHTMPLPMPLCSGVSSLCNCLSDLQAIHANLTLLQPSSYDVTGAPCVAPLLHPPSGSLPFFLGCPVSCLAVEAAADYLRLLHCCCCTFARGSRSQLLCGLLPGHAAGLHAFWEGFEG